MRNKDSFNPHESAATLPPLNDDWAARREAVAALRELIDKMVTADSDAATLRTVAANIQQQTDLLSQGAILHRHAAMEEDYDGRYGTPGQLGYELNPVSGKSNPISPQLDVWIEGDVAYGRATLGMQYEGPPNNVHGGFVCALLDHFLGAAQKITGHYGVTGTLTVRFIRPTPLCTELELKGRVKEARERKSCLVGEIWANGVMTASCECLFIHVDWEQLKKMQPGS